MEVAVLALLAVVACCRARRPRRRRHRRGHRPPPPPLPGTRAAAGRRRAAAARAAATEDPAGAADGTAADRSGPARGAARAGARGAPALPPPRAAAPRAPGRAAAHRPGIRRRPGRSRARRRRDAAGRRALRGGCRSLRGGRRVDVVVVGVDGDVDRGLGRSGGGGHHVDGRRDAPGAAPRRDRRAPGVVADLDALHHRDAVPAARTPGRRRGCREPSSRATTWSARRRGGRGRSRACAPGAPRSRRRPRRARRRRARRSRALTRSTSEARAMATRHRRPGPAADLGAGARRCGRSGRRRPRGSAAQRSHSSAWRADPARVGALDELDRAQLLRARSPSRPRRAGLRTAARCVLGLASTRRTSSRKSERDPWCWASAGQRLVERLVHARLGARPCGAPSAAPCGCRRTRRGRPSAGRAGRHRAAGLVEDREHLGDRRLLHLEVLELGRACGRRSSGRLGAGGRPGVVDGRGDGARWRGRRMELLGLDGSGRTYPTAYAAKRRRDRERAENPSNLRGGCAPRRSRLGHDGAMKSRVGRWAPMLVVPALVLALAGCSGDDEGDDGRREPPRRRATRASDAAGADGADDLAARPRGPAPRCARPRAASTTSTWDPTTCATAAGEQTVERHADQPDRRAHRLPRRDQLDQRDAPTPWRAASRSCAARSPATRPTGRSPPRCPRARPSACRSSSAASSRSNPTSSPTCGRLVLVTPQVVAHRGASHENAEHTLGAYIAALEAGADGLECDVRLTADGHLVCVHDRDLRRTAQQRRPGLHDGPRRPQRARLRRVEEPVGRPRRRGARARRVPRPGADAAQAARDRRRLRPPRRGRDRDQAPDPLRRPRRAAPGRDARATSAGTSRARRCG